MSNENEMYLAITVETKNQAFKIKRMSKSASIQGKNAKGLYVLKVKCSTERYRKDFLRRLKRAEEEMVLNFAFTVYTFGSDASS